MAMERGVGVVTYFNEQTNFGFIDPDDASGDVVFSVRPGEDSMQVGDHVEYDITPMPSATQGGKQALRVRRTGSRPAALVAEGAVS